MKLLTMFLAATACFCMFSSITWAAKPLFLQGEGVSASPTMKKAGWIKNCIVQSGPNRQDLYLVRCKGTDSQIAPAWIKSNPDQSKTSRYFVCPGEGKRCYFKP